MQFVQLTEGVCDSSLVIWNGNPNDREQETSFATTLHQICGSKLVFGISGLCVCLVLNLDYPATAELNDCQDGGCQMRHE